MMTGRRPMRSRAAKMVPSSVNDQQRERALDHGLGEHDALDQVLFLVDERRDELGVVHRAGAHGHELRATLLEVLLDELVSVVDDADGRDGEHAVARTDQQRLRVVYR